MLRKSTASSILCGSPQMQKKYKYKQKYKYKYKQKYKHKHKQKYQRQHWGKFTYTLWKSAGSPILCGSPYKMRLMNCWITSKHLNHNSITDDSMYSVKHRQGMVLRHCKREEIKVKRLLKFIAAWTKSLSGSPIPPFSLILSDTWRTVKSPFLLFFGLVFTWHSRYDGVSA